MKTEEEIKERIFKAQQDRTAYEILKYRASWGACNGIIEALEWVLEDNQ